MEDFINQTPVAGVRVTEATPLDDRYLITNETAIAALQNVEPLPSRMYHGMVILCLDTYKRYIWVESSIGLMNTGYTYPAWYNDINGHDYANKTYNFLLLDDVVRINHTISATDAVNGYIIIPLAKLPIKLLAMPDAVHVAIKSSISSFKEEEFANEIQYTSSGIRVYFSPSISQGVALKLTVY